MREFETDCCNECRMLEAEINRLEKKLQAAQDWIGANSGDMPTPDFTR
jgi:hypothetical protein